MTARLRTILCLTVLVLGTVQVVQAFTRSLIPYEINGRVLTSVYVSDSALQLHEINVNGRRYVVDNDAVADIEVGARLHKDRWSATLVVDGDEQIRLPVGVEAFQFGFLTLISLVAVTALTAASKRP